jgi:putative ABC transport system permease protein
MTWLKQLFSRRRLYGDLSEEIREHLEEKIEELVAGGMSREEAAYAARREFGNVTLVEQDSRTVWRWAAIEDFFTDVRFGARMLRKNPGFTAIALFTLALGIAANGTMFSSLSAWMLKKPAVSDPDRLMVVYGTNSNELREINQNPVSAPNFFTWKKKNRVFSQMAAINPNETASLTGQGEPERVSATRVTANYFSILGVSPALGRTFAVGEDQSGSDRVVILSHTLWERRYGSDPKLVGATIRVNGESHTVIGVMPSGFLLHSFLTQIWTPLVLRDTQQSAAARENRNLYLFARLKTGVSAKQARADIATLGRLAAEAFPDTEKGWGAETLTLQDFMIQSFPGGPSMVMHWCAAGFVLLIACANIAGLLLARAAGRGKEMAIRAAIGAGRGRMVRQLLTEAGLIALLGGALGLAMTFWSVRALQWTEASVGDEESQALQPAVDGHVLFFTSTVSLLAAFLFGLAPALQAGTPNVSAILKNDSATVSAGRGRSRFRSVLVAVEVALAVFSLTGAALFSKAVYDAIHSYSHPGFDPQNLLTARLSLPEARYGKATTQSAFFQELLERLKVLPGVESAAVTSALPAWDAGDAPFRLKGQENMPAGARPRAFHFVVSPNYLRTAGIALIAGRGFTESDNANAPAVTLISEFFARRYFPNGDAIGKQVLIDSGDAKSLQWRQIVGIVRSVKIDPFDVTYAEIYQPFLQRPASSMAVMLRAKSNPEELAPGLREAVWALDKDQPITSVMSMQDQMTIETTGPKWIGTMQAIYAGMALILAVVGLYGLVSFSVGRRSREIGIRIALGAEKRNILRLVLRDGMKLALIGVAIGLVGAFPLPRAFGSLFPGFHVASGWIFVLVSALMSGVVLLACYVPARRAMRVDPIVALRYE